MVTSSSAVKASSSTATVLGSTLSHVVLTIGARRGQGAVPGSLSVTVAEERRVSQTARCPSELLGDGLVTSAHLSPTGKGHVAAWGDEPCEQRRGEAMFSLHFLTTFEAQNAFSLASLVVEVHFFKSVFS